jgi:hypothetical protein
MQCTSNHVRPQCSFVRSTGSPRNSPRDTPSPRRRQTRSQENLLRSTRQCARIFLCDAQICFLQAAQNPSARWCSLVQHAPRDSSPQSLRRSCSSKLAALSALPGTNSPVPSKLPGSAAQASPLRGAPPGSSLGVPARSLPLQPGRVPARRSLPLSGPRRAAAPGRRPLAGCALSGPSAPSEPRRPEPRC